MSSLSSPPSRSRIVRRAAVGLTSAALAFGTAYVGAPARAATPGAASDGPGAASYQAQSRKDCVGTARNRTSKVWYTVANGVLSDVFAPTVDATNVKTMQYIVSDGSSFTDLQTRDTTYTVRSDASGMACTVTSTAKSGKYRLVTTYVTDPARDSVVTHTQYQPLTAAAAAYKIYVRLDANAGGNGGGGASNAGADTAVTDTSSGHPVPVSYDTSTTSQATGRSYAVPSFLALTGDRAFTQVSSGFVGAGSDGLTQLDATHTLSPTYASAADGNVEQTAQVAPDAHGSFTLALGFGTTQASAVSTASTSAHTSFASTAASYTAGWTAYDRGLRRVDRLRGGWHSNPTAVRDYYQSANVVKASEDKTFPGAIVAGIDKPWGQSTPANDPNNLFTTSYWEVFPRDLYEAFTALLVDGDRATAQDTARFLLTKSQLPDGSQPRNSLLNGVKAPDSFNTQPDETAYPLLMAWQSGLAGDKTLYPHVRAEADYLVANGPSYGVERWEEQTGYSPSTIAAEIAGLVAAASIARTQGDATRARIWLATADSWQRSIKKWGVTTTGALSSSPYFIRLSKTGDPNAAISYNVGNGGPTLDQRSVMDLGFLEYVRLGMLPANDATVANSLTVADKVLRKDTASGPGWLRYNGDGYGDCAVPSSSSCTVAGAPWTNGNIGTGHPWPVLGAERAQQELATGDRSGALKLLSTINAMNSGPGLVPEQVWDYPSLAASPYGSNPATASIGFVNGKPDGSASPLTWGAGAQVRLTADLAAGRSLEQPSITVDRYVTHHQQTTPLTVTAPADGSAVGKTVTVSGRAAPGATVDISVSAADASNATIVRTVHVGAWGTFSVAVPVRGGTDVIAVSSTAVSGGTAQVVRRVVSDVVDGTLLYSVTDPTGDDNGPGNYAYPTASDFHPGAFDLTRFEVYDTGSTVTFRVQTRDLTATFGQPNGAQLVDVYVHNPTAAVAVTNPSYPGMNYQIADAAKWSRLIEVQGFSGSKFVGPNGTSAGALTTSANSVSRYITFTVDKTALGGTPDAGWGFTVALTGQDGTHGTDQTRAFAATPQPYAFGVCATASTSPACSADPASVPKVLDTITPAGTTQAGELDYTAHNPVTLTDVVIP
ncbi:glucodextranase DOMON-like domain-containing protein [Allobranchiibius sp. CTAmp26]|uniref:glucodextranase DOMON-like domain-containing protein n=1 Tax=Allobranchiibius sp. CTAmp26 TaxID=2815214 RepID=UPI001AA1A07A|nr:glucodextranase DOMON-like domain-containing protein [Allobranchiibius sp. CTAmp26]MBO1756129.1 hypothetical protein [Allobranchiibius sp. CTAmp26]